MSTATEFAGPAPARIGPPLRVTVAAEWMKLRAMRSTWVIATVGVVLGIGVSSLLALAVGATWDEWSPADRAEFDPIVSPLVGSIFSGVLIVVLGVKVGACEYSGGLARLTLVATPRRGRVLAAKAVVVVAITWTVSAASTIGMFVAAQLVFGAYDMTTAGLGDGDAVRAVASAVALTPIFPLIGLALAVLFRSAAGAISAVLAMMFAPAILGGLLPRGGRRTSSPTCPAWPATASRSPTSTPRRPMCRSASRRGCGGLAGRVPRRRLPGARRAATPNAAQRESTRRRRILRSATQPTDLESVPRTLSAFRQVLPWTASSRCADSRSRHS